MKFRYTPEGADPKEWDFRPSRLLNVEAEKIEDLTGWTWTEFGERFMRQSLKAYHALLYIFLKRETPTLRYDEVQFSVDEIEVVYDDDELDRLVATLEDGDAQGLLDDEQREALAALRELRGDRDDPKAETTETTPDE